MGVDNVSASGVTPVATDGPEAAPEPARSEGLLPVPEIPADAASADVMAVLYAITAKQRDRSSAQRASSAEGKALERKQAESQMQEEIREAKEAEEEGSWIDGVMDAFDSVADAVVGGNPLQDVAQSLSDATGIEAFEIAYDVMRPDALLNAAACVATAATERNEIKQTADLRPWEAPKASAAGAQGDASGPSLKTRFQAGADLSGRPEVMDVYGATRTAIAGAMVTVGTCGTGTVAIVMAASSAALIAESKADLLGKAGVADEEKTWIRLGAQAALLIACAGASMASSTTVASSGARAAVNIANGANQVGRGSAQVGKAMYEREASDHMAEAAKHEGAQKRIDREQQRLVRGLREVTQSYQRTLETLAGSMHERDQTSLMLSRQIA